MKNQTTQRIGTYLSLSLSVGAGVLGAMPADAAIVPYTGGPVTVGVGHTLWWNPAQLTAGADADPKIGLDFNYNGDNSIYTERSFEAGFGSIGTGDSLDKFTTIDMIDSSTTWWASDWTYMTKAKSPWAAAGNKEGYVAFYFQDTTDPPNKYYGWADIYYDLDNKQLTLNSYAYENSPNTGILAGNTGSVTAVPEPSTLKLGLLVLGASGLVALRRKRKAAGEALPTS